MSYQEELPFVNLVGDEIEFADKLLFTKGAHWEYEREYRLIKTGHYRTVVTLPSEVFACVVLGHKMSQGDKFETLDLLANKLPDVAVFEARLSESCFNLDVVQIR